MASKKYKKKRRKPSDKDLNIQKIGGKEFFFKEVKITETIGDHLSQYQFSDYSQSNDSESSGDDDFADSKEVLSDADMLGETSTPITPSKRCLNSPESNKKNKKSRESSGKH